MAFIICIAALIIMMFVFTKMLLSFRNNSSAAVESVDATVVEKKQGIYIHMRLKHMYLGFALYLS